MYSFNTAPVKIVVGPEEECFHVHASALTSTSEFFKSALKKEWRKTGDRDIDLRDQQTETFSSYVHWLYYNEIITDMKWTCADDDEIPGPDFDSLGELYVLGEHLIDTAFQDAVISVLVGLTRKKDQDDVNYYPGFSTVNIIYEGTTDKSPARRLLVDLHVRHGNENWIKDHCVKNGSDCFNHEFLTDLSQALLKDRVLLYKHQKKYAQFDAGIPCKYHNHAKDQPCKESQT